MYKLVALYRKPEDPAEFERLYLGEHIPLVMKQPHVHKVELSRVSGSPFGDSEFHYMAELYFADEAAMKESLSSDEARTAGRQLNTFAKGLYTFFFAEVTSDDVVAASA